MQNNYLEVSKCPFILVSKVVKDVPGREKDQSKGRPESEGGLGGGLSGLVGENTGHIVDLVDHINKAGFSLQKHLDLSNV